MVCRTSLSERLQERESSNQDSRTTTSKDLLTKYKCIAIQFFPVLAFFSQFGIIFPFAPNFGFFSASSAPLSPAVEVGTSSGGGIGSSAAPANIEASNGGVEEAKTKFDQ